MLKSLVLLSLLLTSSAYAQKIDFIERLEKGWGEQTKKAEISKTLYVGMPLLGKEVKGGTLNFDGTPRIKNFVYGNLLTQYIGQTMDRKSEFMSFTVVVATEQPFQHKSGAPVFKNNEELKIFKCHFPILKFPKNLDAFFEKDFKWDGTEEKQKVFIEGSFDEKAQILKFTKADFIYLNDDLVGYKHNLEIQLAKDEKTGKRVMKSFRYVNTVHSATDKALNKIDPKVQSTIADITVVGPFKEVEPEAKLK